MWHITILAQTTLTKETKHYCPKKSCLSSTVFAKNNCHIGVFLRRGKEFNHLLSAKLTEIFYYHFMKYHWPPPSSCLESLRTTDWSCSATATSGYVSERRIAWN